MSTASSAMNGSGDTLRSVVIWGYTNHLWLWVPLARELKRRHGVAVHFLCTNEQSVAYWKRQDPDGIIDSFTTTNHFFLQYDDVSADTRAIYATARANEERYGVYVVDALQTDRHLGRGFAAAGSGHPRSQWSDRATYEKSAHLFNRVVQFWEEYFDRVQPSFIIGNASGVAGKLCSVIARQRGIPMRVLFLLYYQAFHAWGVDEYYSVPQVEDRYRTMTDADATTTVSDAECAAMRRLPFTDAYYRAFSANATLRFVAIWTLRQARLFIERYLRRIVTAEYRLVDRIRVLLRTRADLRWFARMSFPSTPPAHGGAYVFFPLHVEPESSMGMMAPEMNEQLACIELLAKNLPAGVRLVVKEHLAAVGRRPRDFYTTLLDIPNVIVLSPHAYALDVARNVRAVAVITGTLGLEAAVLGVPVISFGLHNLYGFLPHVHTVESWTALRSLLAQLCDADDDPAACAQRVRDGRRFLAALKSVGFDFSWSDYTAKQRPPATPREVDVCYRALVAGLDGTPVAPV